MLLLAFCKHFLIQFNKPLNITFVLLKISNIFFSLQKKKTFEHYKAKFFQKQNLFLHTLKLDLTKVLKKKKFKKKAKRLHISWKTYLQRITRKTYRLMRDKNPYKKLKLKTIRITTKKITTVKKRSKKNRKANFNFNSIFFKKQLTGTVFEKNTIEIKNILKMFFSKTYYLSKFLKRSTTYNVKRNKIPKMLVKIKQKKPIEQYKSLFYAIRISDTSFNVFRSFYKACRRNVRLKSRFKQRRRRRCLVFLLKYRLLKFATKDVNFIKIKLSVQNIFISFFRRVKGLFLKATCGMYGYTGAKKTTTFAYEHTALNIAKAYYKQYYISLLYKTIHDKIAARRKKRKSCVVFFSKHPLFFHLRHHLLKRQIKSIVRGFKKAKLRISFLSYNPKTAHNGLWLRKKKRV